MNWIEYMRRGEAHIGWRTRREGSTATIAFHDGSDMTAPAAVYDRAWMRVWILDSAAPEAWNPATLAMEVRKQIDIVQRNIVPAASATGERAIWPSLAYICAECGGIAYTNEDSIDTGTTFTDERCGGKTVVTLSTPAEFAASAAMTRALETGT